MPRSSPRSTRARPKKGSGTKRRLAIAIVVVGVVLEVLANVVQLAESPLVHDAVSSALQASVPAKVHEVVRAALR